MHSVIVISAVSQLRFIYVVCTTKTAIGGRVHGARVERFRVREKLGIVQYLLACYPMRVKVKRVLKYTTAINAEIITAEIIIAQWFIWHK
jgi:hypothetical protein